MQTEIKPVPKALAVVLNVYRDMLDKPKEPAPAARIFVRSGKVYREEAKKGFVQESYTWHVAPFHPYCVEWCNSGGRLDTAELMCGYYEEVNGDICWENQWVFIPGDDGEWHLLTHQADIPYFRTFHSIYLDRDGDGTLSLRPLQPDEGSYPEMVEMAAESVIQAWGRNSLYLEGTA